MELMMDFTPPEGFKPLENLPPAYDYGKFYYSDTELGFFVRPEHSRSNKGHAGGGIFLVGADYLMGHVLHKKLFGMQLKQSDYHPTTITMTSDFLGTAHVGNWITAKVEILKIGRQLCSAQCLLMLEGKPIFRASASYMMVPKAPKQ
jgi:acyl-CoA thioesterase FadM